MALFFLLVTCITVLSLPFFKLLFEIEQFFELKIPLKIRSYNYIKLGLNSANFTQA